MGIDFLVNLIDEIEVFDDSGVYTLGTQQFIYEVNNLGLVDVLLKILDPKYIFKPVKGFSKKKEFFGGYASMVLMDVIDYYPLNRIVMPARGRKTNCLVEGCLWGWLDNITHIHRTISVDDVCGYIVVYIDEIDAPDFSITFDGEKSIMEYELREGEECIKKMIRTLYTLNLKESCSQETVYEIVKILKFLEKNYPMVIRF